MESEQNPSIFYQIKTRGIDFLNDFMPSCWEKADEYSEYFKGLLLFIAGLSVVMMVASPYGWMYACYPRPFTLPIVWNNVLYLNRTIPENLAPSIPEWGIHYATLFTFALAMWFGVSKFESQKIDKPVHKIGYIFFLAHITFFIPFELTYITLYDIFHNIPRYGYPAIWSYGWWRGIGMLKDSVITQDVILPIMSIIGMYVIKQDLDDYYPTKIKFDATAKLLLVAFFSCMLIWVALPLVTSSPDGFGTKWFPQTVYVDYGFFEDHNITSPIEVETYGVVKDYWFKNDIVRFVNQFTKLVSVVFMFYTFIPRRTNSVQKEDTRK